MTDADRVAIKANPDLLKEIGGLRKVLDDLGKLEKDVAPNYPELDRIRKMSPDEINEWINEAGNYAQLMIWDAGKKTDELKEIFDKRMGKTSGKSGDGGGGGGNNAIAVNDMFQQSFGSINKNWWGAAIAYDPSNPEHKRQEANFRTIYNDRVGMKREAEGRKLTYSEQREMFFDLMREVRRGSVKLDRPLAEGDPMAAMDAPERSESVNPETGKKEVTFAPEKEGGDPETFEVMPYLAWQAYNVPGAKDGYIAMAPGERFGVTYEAGDRIIITVNPRTGKQDGVVLYDANYNFKTGKAGGGIAADANDFAARRGAPTPIPEPPKPPKMKAWEQEHGAVFVWEKYANRWNADKPDANEPGRNVTYQASPDGTMIYPNPFGIKITDADFLPPPPPEPESVARIRRKIERLEAEVAISERDPRTRKDLEQDKREEIKALKDEFNRISGANARASKFYVGETGKFDRPVSSEKKN
ncbi:MAG: hypothetical protein LUG50_11615 [Planctomycetaceae bacterium]|nr:hypothetical protein [Planctomycetaceae bacterium]